MPDIFDVRESAQVNNLCNRSIPLNYELTTEDEEERAAIQRRLVMYGMAAETVSNKPDEEVWNMGYLAI